MNDTGSYPSPAKLPKYPTPYFAHRPEVRKLRGYAFDPSLSLRSETAAINEIVYEVPWERLQSMAHEEVSMLKDDPGSLRKGPGPTGEYIEVVDYDPTVGRFYKPVDLNEKDILANDGLTPSESNPQFHQQMVYAVAMTTINNFEKALGRKILWSPRKEKKAGWYEDRYVQQLRLYPHAMRDANAYYSPQKKAILFGYFSASPADETLHMPGSLVFTCLSHDIIAHEVTHAILDGMHRHYNEPSNPDVLAFHEAFADIVALFQHFTFPEVLKSQIAKTRGELESQNLLGELAQEFGYGTGNYGSLRQAIGEIDPSSKKWKLRSPDPAEYREVSEPHKRGSILVSAIFEAFVTIYKARVADLNRIATNGTGVLPQGEIHPDLVNRLAREAALSATHVLNMCIRALDYCPPVDITYGDYLRAIITADLDLVPEDNFEYRLAFIDAFRRRGIYPRGIKTLSIESLAFTREPAVQGNTSKLFLQIGEFLRDFRNEMMYTTKRAKIFRTTEKYMSGKGLSLHNRLTVKFGNSREFQQLTGLVFNKKWKKLGIKASTRYQGGTEGPAFEVQNLRIISRTGPEENQVNQIIFTIVQQSGVLVSDRSFAGYYIPSAGKDAPDNGFLLSGGCTLIFDLDTLRLRYAIAKPLLDLDQLSQGVFEIDKRRAENQAAYQREVMPEQNEFSQYFGVNGAGYLDEPFALLHQH